MAPEDDGELYRRAITISMMLLMYAGTFLTDPDEALGLMALDDTLSKLFPADACLGVMLVMSWLCEAAGFDADDCKILGQSVIDGMIGDDSKTTTGGN